LIRASGLHEEAAKVCDCPKGTMKSRVSRARTELLQILEEGLLADKRRDTPSIAGFVGDVLRGRPVVASPAMARSADRVAAIGAQRRGSIAPEDDRRCQRS
jgi:hypothetical protein